MCQTGGSPTPVQEDAGRWCQGINPTYLYTGSGLIPLGSSYQTQSYDGICSNMLTTFYYLCVYTDMHAQIFISKVLPRKHFVMPKAGSIDSHFVVGLK